MQLDIDLIFEEIEHNTICNYLFLGNILLIVHNYYFFFFNNTKENLYNI